MLPLYCLPSSFFSLLSFRKYRYRLCWRLASILNTFNLLMTDASSCCYCHIVVVLVEFVFMYAIPLLSVQLTGPICAKSIAALSYPSAVFIDTRPPDLDSPPCDVSTRISRINRSRISACSRQHKSSIAFKCNIVDIYE